MFQKLFLTLITFVNLGALYAVQFYSKFEPFYIITGTYLISCILVLLFYQLSSAPGSNLARLIEKMLSSSKAIIFLTFLAVLDLIIFMLFVPTSSITFLETEMQTKFLFIGFLIFFIPFILTKINIDPKGKDIEELFWTQFLESIQSKKPSPEFSLFILAKIQLKFLPLNKRKSTVAQENVQNEFISDEISTTTFPLDYSQNLEPQELEQPQSNPLFDSEESYSEENVFEKYFEEIYQLIPELKQLVEKKPVNIRPELFLNIIIEKTLRDEKMMKFFKECSEIKIV